MDFDVDLMRDLLLDLETRQTSPQSTVVLSVDSAAMAIGRPAVDVENGLAGLLDLAYVDGPGAEVPGFFHFRTLTPKGAQFVRATRSPREWERMKRHFAQRRFEDSA